MPYAGEISSGSMRFQWKITDFQVKLEESPFGGIKSPLFRYEGTTWFLILRVKDKYNPGPIKDVSLYICGGDENFGKYVDISLGFCTIDGKEGKALETKALIGTDEFWGPLQFCVDLDKIAPSGTITVFCYMKKDEDEEWSKEESTDYEESSDEEEELEAIHAECCVSLYKDMGKLFLDDTLCDVNLLLGENSLKAHSSVLSCRSTVFREMLKEHPESLHLEDCEIFVFAIFLEFLYVGRIEDPTPTIAFKLYRQAHLYKVSFLKKQCLDIMHRYLSIDTIYDAIRLAKKYCASELLEKAKELLMNNC